MHLRRDDRETALSSEQRERIICGRLINQGRKRGLEVGVVLFDLHILLAQSGNLNLEKVKVANEQIKFKMKL